MEAASLEEVIENAESYHTFRSNLAAATDELNQKEALCILLTKLIAGASNRVKALAISEIEAAKLTPEEIVELVIWISIMRMFDLMLIYSRLR